MKIITEKITSEPYHSITKKDIEAIISIIPDEWVGKAHVFYISAQLFKHSKWDRPVIQNGTRFNILSRGVNRQDIIKELLIELAVNPSRNYPALGHSLTKAQRKKLEELVKPYVDLFH